MRRRGLSVLGLVWSILLIGCRTADRPPEKTTQASAANAPASSGVIHLTPEQVRLAGLQTALAEERQVTATINATGRVRARTGAESQVLSPFRGRIIADPARLPRIGMMVRKDQVLAGVEQMLAAPEALQISVSRIQLQAAMDHAEQEVRLTRVEFERSKALYDGGAISLKQLQAAEFAYQQAQTRLDSARKAKAEVEAVEAQSSSSRQAPLRSPISGVVIAADITPGEQVDAGKSLFTIADLTRVWIEAQVFENEISQMRQARSATVILRAYPQETFTGRLVTIGNIVDPASRTVTVIFEAGNPQQRIKLGMLAEVRISTGQPMQAFLIPSQAVLQEEGRSLVYVEAAPGSYQRTEVSVARREGGLIVVTSGLKAGQRVVTVGAEVLRSEASRAEIPREGEAH